MVESHHKERLKHSKAPFVDMQASPSQHATLQSPLDAFKQEPQDLSPLERAAYHFAKAKHQGQPRKKAIPRLTQEGEYTGNWQVVEYPYDVHLHLVHSLLKKAGVTDQATLCAAFMHDMIEDCKDKAGDNYTPATLKNEFVEYIQQHTSNTHNITATVNTTIGYVQEVTNPPKENMPFGKRIHQSQKMRHASPDAKLLKIADQTASLIEDVMIKSEREIDPVKKEKNTLKKFTVKARDVVVACQEDSEKNNFLRAVEDEYYRYAMSLIKFERDFANFTPAEHQKEEQAIRNSIQLEEVFTRAKQSHHHDTEWRYEFPKYEPFRNEYVFAEKTADNQPFAIFLNINGGQVQGIRFSFPDEATSHTILKQSEKLIQAIENLGDDGTDEHPRVKSRIEDACRDVRFLAKKNNFRETIALELGLHTPISIHDCLSALQQTLSIPSTSTQQFLQGLLDGQEVASETVWAEKTPANTIHLDLLPLEKTIIRPQYAGSLKQHRTLDGRFAHHPSTNTSQNTR